MRYADRLPARLRRPRPHGPQAARRAPAGRPHRSPARVRAATRRRWSATAPARTTYAASTGTSPPGALEPHVWRTRAEHEVETWVLRRRDREHGLRHRRRRRRPTSPRVTGGRRPAHRRAGQPVGRRPPPRRRRALVAAPRRPRMARRLAAAGRCGPTGAGPRRAGAPRRPRRGDHAARATAPAARAAGRRVRLRSSPTAHRAPVRLGGRRCAGSPPATTSSWSRCSTRASSSCRDVGPVVLVDPETGHQREVWTSLRGSASSTPSAAAAHRTAVAAGGARRAGRAPRPAHRPRLGRATWPASSRARRRPARAPRPGGSR